MTRPSRDTLSEFEARPDDPEVIAAAYASCLAERRDPPLALLVVTAHWAPVQAALAARGRAPLTPPTLDLGPALDEAEERLAVRFPTFLRELYRVIWAKHEVRALTFGDGGEWVAPDQLAWEGDQLVFVRRGGSTYGIRAADLGDDDPAWVDEAGRRASEGLIAKLAQLVRDRPPLVDDRWGPVLGLVAGVERADAPWFAEPYTPLQEAAFAAAGPLVLDPAVGTEEVAQVVTFLRAHQDEVGPRALNLSGCARLTPEALRALGGLPGVQAVDVTGRAARDADCLEALGVWPDLAWVRVGSGPSWALERLPALKALTLCAEEALSKKAGVAVGHRARPHWLKVEGEGAASVDFLRGLAKGEGATWLRELDMGETRTQAEHLATLTRFKLRKLRLGSLLELKGDAFDDFRKRMARVELEVGVHDAAAESCAYTGCGWLVAGLVWLGVQVAGWGGVDLPPEIPWLLGGLVLAWVGMPLLLPAHLPRERWWLVLGGLTSGGLAWALWETPLSLLAWVPWLTVAAHYRERAQRRSSGLSAPPLS